MIHTDERSRLLANENRPQYAFHSSIARERKIKVKQFQCCLCAILLGIMVVLLVVSVSYGINGISDNTGNITTANDSIELAPTESLNLLLSSAWPIADKQVRTKRYTNDSEWNEALVAGQAALDHKDELEETTPILPIDSPSYRHQKVLSTSDKAQQLARIGYVQEFVSRYIQRNMSKPEIQRICSKNDEDSILIEFCEKNNTQCDIFSKYRTYDGSCNNLKYPNSFGRAYIPFRRSLPPDYADGISVPRRSKNGEPLPSARLVSLVVHRPYYRDDPKFSVMLAIWGQFLDHDITATALNKGANGSSISCCENNSTVHPECFPVITNEEDPLNNNNATCMEFVRSSPAPTCCLGQREQFNQATAFIDGSVVYGAERDVALGLRSLIGGRLRMYVTNDNRTLLPISDDLSDGCNREEARLRGKYCFVTGDARSNENLHLTSMHLIFARHHNEIASNLSRINPHWDDERLFQESRRILIAQMQHISYNEFLPALLGCKLMKRFDLLPQKVGYFKKYNDSIDPSIANNFATAAFRFAHTIIPSLMKLLANDTSSPEYVQMHKMLFNPFQLYVPGELDRTLRGAINTNIEASDAYFSNELKRNLFQREDNQNRTTKPKRHGLDLVSLNIQRGRDHGLPPYTEWRQHCGLSKPKSFAELADDLDGNSLNNIKSIYKDVDDIDLYTGALSEKPLNNSILGPTITCLLLDQYTRLKYGDRFFYETPNQPYGFKPQQLNEIRKTRLAKIICDNSDNVDYAQPLVMEKIRKGNENVPCSDIPRTNFTLWKESLNSVTVPDNKFEIVTYTNMMLRRNTNNYSVIHSTVANNTDQQ